MNLLELAWEIFPKLLQGTAVTLELTGLSVALGFVTGVLLALGRMYGNKPISLACSAYIELLRGTPLLVQLFIWYYGLPSLGIRLSSFVAAFIGLGLNSGAYQAEYFRGAIQSISGGQMAAARSIGMSRFKAIRSIILPQALRIVIPPWSNELIYTVKYSSLAYMIGTAELMAQGKFIAADNFRFFEVFLVVAFVYLVIVLILSRILDMVEMRLRIPGLMH